jgi:AraC family transcriptional regulator
MGVHAFDEEPAHLALYRRLGGAVATSPVGVAERWNAPVSRQVARLGEATDFPGVDHYVLTIQIAGPVVRRVDRPVVDEAARDGAVSLQAPGSGGRFRAEAAAPVDYAHLYFRQSLLDEVDDGHGGRRGAGRLADFFGQPDGELPGQVAAYLTRAFDTADPPGPIEMDSRAYLIALDLLRRHRATPVGDPQGSGLPGGRVARVHALIMDRLHEPIRLSDLAGAAGLTPYHFARSFRSETGETPLGYVMRLRLERARDLLARTRLPIAEIAAATGFASQAHLTTRFRRSFGVTPARFREG